MRHIHNCRQFVRWAKNWESLDRPDFWMMSNWVGKRWNRKCLMQRKHNKRRKTPIRKWPHKWYYSPNLLSPMADSTTTAVELMYKMRLPNVLIFSKKKQLPAMLVRLKIMAALLTSIGTPNARITWIKYGRHIIAPANSKRKFNRITNTNGFILRFCCSSLILSNTFAFGWWHLIACWAHDTHAVDKILWFWSFVNSSCTNSGSTHPRSHCNDRCASFGRSFDISQFGVSGIYIRKMKFNSKFDWNWNWLAFTYETDGNDNDDGEYGNV